MNSLLPTIGGDGGCRPGGVADGADGHVSLYLDCRDATSSHPAYEKHVFRVVNQRDSENNYEQHSLPYKENKDPDGWGWGKFIAHSLKDDNDPGFIVNDTLKLELELTVYGSDPETVEIPFEGEVENVVVPPDSLAYDMNSILDSGRYSNVVFIGSWEYRTLRGIASSERGRAF